MEAVCSDLSSTDVIEAATPLGKDTQDDVAQWMEADTERSEHLTIIYIQGFIEIGACWDFHPHQGKFPPPRILIFIHSKICETPGNVYNKRFL